MSVPFYAFVRTRTSFKICPQVLDLDGDGKLSKAELRAAIESVVGLSTFEGQDELLEMVMEAGGDADKDGNITIEELNA